MYAPAPPFMGAPPPPNNKHREDADFLMRDTQPSIGKIENGTAIMNDAMVAPAVTVYRTVNGIGVGPSTTTPTTFKQLQQPPLAFTSTGPRQCGRPRRPKSAFEVFVQYEKHSLEEKLRGKGAVPQDAAVTDLLRMQWKSAQQWQKEVYKQLAESDRLRYRKEIIQWNADSKTRQGLVGEYLRSKLVKPAVPNFVTPPMMQPVPNYCVDGVNKRRVSFEDARSSKVARFSHNPMGMGGAHRLSDWDAMVNSRTSLISHGSGHFPNM